MSTHHAGDRFDRAGWQLAPGSLLAAAIQFAAAALCAAIGLIFGSAAAGAAALFPLTDAWAHWRAADRIAFGSRAPNAWVAVGLAAVAIAAAGAGIRALVSPAASAAAPLLLVASIGLVAGLGGALAVLPLRLRDASGLPGWQCGRAWPTAPAIVGIAGAAVWLFGSARADLVAATALGLAYAASVVGAAVLRRTQ